MPQGRAKAAEIRAGQVPGRIHVREKRNQAERQAAQNEKHRIRQVDLSCDDVQRSDDHQQEADEFYLGHIATKKDFRPWQECTLRAPSAGTRSTKTPEESRPGRARSLSPVEFLRSLDVEMTHPSAFEANSMAGIPVLSGHGPAEISTLVRHFPCPTFVTTCPITNRKSSPAKSESTSPIKTRNVVR